MATFHATFSEIEEFQASFSDSGTEVSADFGEVIKVSTSNYEELFNKPKINTVEVKGDKTGSDYNLQNKLKAGSGIKLEGTTISTDLEYASYIEVLDFLNS